jgi:PAS domain S-box-containing protein
LITKKDPAQKSKIVKAAEVNLNPLKGIQECAAVIQRGILKQVNPSFTMLLGYVAEDIVNKSIFDFIVPEGFSTIENFYFKRLKGQDINSFETVFITKYNSKLPVEVSTRPTNFNGEKAELAIFKKINEKQK